jgi:hypothetical protein
MLSGVALDGHGYDGLARLADALLDAGQYVRVGAVH